MYHKLLICSKEYNDRNPFVELAAKNATENESNNDNKITTIILTLLITLLIM